MIPKQKIMALQAVVIAVLTAAYYLFKGVVFAEPVLAAGLFAAGMVIGTALLWLDENWFVKYYSGEIGNEAGEAVKQQLLITRSLLFILALVPMSLYILTSTGSSLGIGVLLGIITGLALEMAVLAGRPDILRKRFLSQLKRPATENDLSWFIRIFLVFTIIISALVVF